MKVFTTINKKINTDKTIVVVLILTLLLIGLMLNSHRWQAIPDAIEAPLSEALPDFTSITQVAERKQAFFDYLRPFIRQENQRIRYDKAFLASIESDIGKIGDHHRSPHRKLQRLAKRYRVEATNPDETIEALKLRIDVIPESLVLVQAANESAWGTSRFAKQANNLFGQWCYTKGCGLVPKSRAANAKHEVRRFDSPQASIVSYMRNLNTHSAYRDFRIIRHQLRNNGQKLTGTRLADGLEQYSERRGEYVEELKTMIRHNNLE
ncbi:hypothetical protein FLL45_21280 [Aliikangiella marina]|uniref:Mannosyl-glycoprotein endo-beta-N-acetylglucosamidase-like domain-containing protein n=1 Tax=Aliikangiella marina TaxID=1712262 RepID=A0A545T3A0_9GAMM|nr:glucosaminidase domain-containing protein [Aliikangiella marina]TQV71668.1 hypothetical protein FLL45_21200 [Aliikangiella marina]TQV71683.1 hypothetical protein FLL45_21280 [Aliikangiella marina]